MAMDIFPLKRPGPIDVKRRPNVLAALFLRLWIWGGIGLAVLTGCAAVGPDYVRPELKVPDQWRHGTGQAHPRNLRLLPEWWQIFDDPVLTRLIHQAAAGNLDLREALSRVREARFQHRKNRSSLFPTVEASGAARKSGSGGENGDTTESELYVAEFDASWELDLFGGVRRSIEATRADIQAQVEDLNDVMVTLLAEVAVNYIELRTYQTRLAVALHNVDAQKETLELLEALSRAGMGDDLAAAQARYNLEGSRAKVPDLTVSIETAINRLAVLTGQPAGPLHAELSDAKPLSTVSTLLAVGIPADVIRRRPDIRRAERQLAAQTARIGEAEADLYPKLTLSGSIGMEALSFGDLFSSASRVWSYGPSFSWPVFRAGAIRNNIKVQKELQQQALLRYEAALLSALEEVENSLISYSEGLKKFEMLQSASEAARTAAELAVHQYATGMTGFSDVLDAQRSLLSFEDQVAESQGALLTGIVQLYKALGGGWQSLGRTADSNLLKGNQG